jgi:hypothetical protein
MNPPTNWQQLKSRCANSACNTANGGCTIILSGNFVMGSYTGEISFSSKAISIWGQGKVLDPADPAEGGRFFNGEGGGSFLELHDVVLQNGRTYAVSGRVLVVVAVVESCSEAVPIPGGDMQLSLTRHRSFNTAWIGINYKVKCKSAFQLSFI